MGKTITLIRSSSICQKHPHVRGEDLCKSLLPHHQKETPPRAWGRHVVKIQRGNGLGNTPTCVGKTGLLAQDDRIAEKHPHVRGEDCANDLHLTAALETPPRAWGRHRQAWMEPPAIRNTPTCVGKTEKAEKEKRDV